MSILEIKIGPASPWQERLYDLVIQSWMNEQRDWRQEWNFVGWRVGPRTTQSFVLSLNTVDYYTLVTRSADEAIRKNAISRFSYPSMYE